MEEEIKRDVVDHLVWDDRVNAAEVSVEVHDSTVVLRGEVPSHRSRIAAIEDTQFIPGVFRVEDQLIVRWPPPYVFSDKELSDKVDNIIRLNTDIDTSDITINVNEGVVLLEGTVDGLWKKDLIESTVANVAGVVGVENNLKIAPPRKITDDTITNQIINALKRNSLVDAELIDIRVSNGVVTLSGTVPSWSALRVVLNTADQTTGVVEVHDELTLSV
ncbi:MAG: BON domain-containing protein [Pirellulales bacterium]|nr:BON domain-containing protein [Pirellulales bacterium]